MNGRLLDLVQQLEKIDLCDEDEKKLVDTIYWASLDNLNEDDKRLPQVANLLPLLRRGIGLHHSGLLPILKEAIELLFQEGLLKVLVATETMSTGLNMPARCVVFTSPRKFDGSGYRWISSGEYVQMSGRAGRRGLDDRGLVILMMDERMDPAVAKDMLHGGVMVSNVERMHSKHEWTDGPMNGPMNGPMDQAELVSTRGLKGARFLKRLKKSF